VILLIASFPLLVLVIENASSLDVGAAVKNPLAKTAGTLDTLAKFADGFARVSRNRARLNDKLLIISHFNERNV